MIEAATNTSPVPPKPATPAKQASPVEPAIISPTQQVAKILSPTGSKKSAASPLGSARVAITPPSGRPIAPTPNKEDKAKKNGEAEKEEKAPSPPLSPATRASVCRNL